MVGACVVDMVVEAGVVVVNVKADVVDVVDEVEEVLVVELLDAELVSDSEENQKRNPS